MRFSAESIVGINMNNPDYSEEAYFGIECDFSKEVIKYCSELREELRTIVGGSWADENKRTILITEQLPNKTSKGKVSDLTNLEKILDGLGDCIARHCNIEACYIGLQTDLNAGTLSLDMDATHIIDNTVKNIFIPRIDPETGEKIYCINKNAIKDNDGVTRSLVSLDDIVLNKNGYKFKSKKGKIFIISIGIPLLIDKTIESSPEECAAILFHEIGHNFQQILHGINQMILDYYIRNHLEIIHSFVFFKIFGLLSSFITTIFLNKAIKEMNFSKQSRYIFIREVLFGSIFINPSDGSLTTRKDIGEYEKEQLYEIIEYIKKEKLEKKLNLFSKIFSTIGNTIKGLFNLVCTPLDTFYRMMIDGGLTKNYSDVIKYNKKYEQFADAFAISYGFGKYSGKFYIEIAKLKARAMEKSAMPTFLSYIPVLSLARAMENYKTRIMSKHVSGYDMDHVRIAQVYRVLQYELDTNKELSSEHKKEILAHMEESKKDYDRFLKLEQETYSKNPNIGKKIYDKFRQGEIGDVANESGIVENVLEIVAEFEKTGVIDKPPIVKRIESSITKSEDAANSKNQNWMSEVSDTIIDPIKKGIDKISELFGDKTKLREYTKNNIDK